MRGSYEVIVRNARVQFKLRLTRNITIVRGNSATGKTTLIDMIADLEANGEASGVTVNSRKPCVTLSGALWKEKLAGVTDSFVFIDEGNEFIRSNDFARCIRESDNYYVLATREILPALPYSVEEVYEFRNTTSRYRGARRFYTRTERMYGKVPTVVDPELVVVEDSNAGYEFYRALCDKSGIECISASGKSNMIDVLRKRNERRVLAIADGAAFGPEMEMVYTLAMVRGYGLFLPESFEWLILRSGLVKSNDVGKVLANPANYIESREYFSWERFFTDYLRKCTDGTYLSYEKSKLNSAYLQPNEMAAVSSTLGGTGLVDAGGA